MSTGTKRSYQEPDNDDTSTGSFDVFSTPAEDEPSVAGIYWKEFEPIETTVDKKTIRIELDNEHMSSFIDLKAVQIYVTSEIVNADGITKVDVLEDTTLINNGIGSIFQDVLLQYDYKVLMDCNAMYNYMSYFMNLLSYGASSVKSLGAAALFYPDTGGQFNDTTIENKGFTQRKVITNGKFIMGGQLNIPLCNQDRFFVNQGKKLELIFKVADDDFVIHTDGKDEKKYKLVIHKIVVRVKYVTPIPKVLNSIRLKLKNGGKANYLLKRPHCSFSGISNQSNVYTTTIGSQKFLPSHVMIAVCLDSQRNGDPKTSPYCFMGKTTAFEIDNVIFQTSDTDISTKSMNPNFSSEAYTKTYIDLYESLGLFRGISNQEVPVIPYKEFAEGYCIFSHSLNPDSNDMSMFTQEGSLKVTIKFKAIPTEALNIIILAMYDSLLTIDGGGYVTKSWVI